MSDRPVKPFGENLDARLRQTAVVQRLFDRRPGRLVYEEGVN
jgi:hypothetical protein